MFAEPVLQVVQLSKDAASTVWTICNSTSLVSMTLSSVGGEITRKSNLQQPQFDAIPSLARPQSLLRRIRQVEAGQ